MRLKNLSCGSKKRRCGLKIRFCLHWSYCGLSCCEKMMSAWKMNPRYVSEHLRCLLSMLQLSLPRRLF